VDDKNAEQIGQWGTGKFGNCFGNEYLFHSKGTGSNQVRFQATLPKPGQYEVYEWHPAGLNRAENASFVVLHQWGTNKVEVNQQLNGSRWNLLGTFSFGSPLFSVE